MRLRRALFFAAALVMLMAFPYGPLFPLSPWKPGYQHLALERADVYWPDQTALPDAYRSLDTLIGRTERFLQLRAHQRITVVDTGNWLRFRRLMPHMASHALGAVTLATGTIIYVTPRLDEKHLDHGEYLLHELGHAVIHQNQTVPAAFRFVRIEWLAEGISVANGQQRSYLSREQFLERARKEPLSPVVDREHGPVSLDMRFAYPTWRYFNEFLIDRYGRDHYQDFLLQTMRDPSGWRQWFGRNLGAFDQAIQEFQDSVRQPDSR